MVTVSGGASSGLEESKCHFYLQEKQERGPWELRTGQPYISPWEAMGQIIRETISKHIKKRR